MPTLETALDSDGARVDAIFSLTEAASIAGYLPDVLRRLCRRIARTLPAEVVSIYLREDDPLGDVMIMRANHGFRQVAVGNVCLRVGEGITGLAAEVGKPVYSERDDARSVSFDALQEDRFPVLLAMPVLRRGRVIAVLVVQRRPGEAFDSPDIALAASMTSPVALALEHATHRRRHAAAVRGGEPHEVRLDGVGRVPGVALARAELVASFASLTETTPNDALDPSLAAVVERLSVALANLKLPEEREHERVVLATVLHDERFRRTLVEEASARGVPAALSVVARRYALAPAVGEAGVSDRWLEERAAEVGSLCRLIAAQVGRRAICRHGGALCLAEPPGALLALEAVRCRAAAVVVADEVRAGSLAVAILAAGRVPLLTEVGGLFDRVQDADPVVVDASRNALFIHPSPTRAARAKR